MSLLPIDIDHFTIRLPRQSGGKAGKGKNKTSTIQVYDSRNSTVIKQIPFTIATLGSQTLAIEKAIKFVEDLND